MTGHRVDTPGRAYLLLALASLFWSGVFVLGRGTHEDVPPIALTFFRYFIALALLLGLSWRHLRTEWRIVLSAWPWFAAFGLLNVTMFPILTLLALGRTTAINATLINSTQPVMMVALAWAAYRETIGLRQGLGILASLAGVLAIITEGDPALVLELDLNAGDLLVVIALFCWSVYSVTMRHLPSGLHPNTVVFGMVVMGLPFTLPFYGVEIASGRTLSLDWTTALTLLYFGTLPSVFAFAFWNRGVGAIGPARAGLFVHLIPVFGTLQAILLLGEELGSYHAVGILCVVAGIYLATARRLLPRRLRRLPRAGGP